MSFVPHGVSFDLIRLFAERLQAHLRPDASIMAVQEAFARAAGYPNAHALDQAAQRWRPEQDSGVPTLPGVSPRRVKAWSGPFRQAWWAGGQGAALPALAMSWGHASGSALHDALRAAIRLQVNRAPLMALGMTASQAQDWIEAVMKISQTGWLFSGATCTGKTTTLRTTLKMRPDPTTPAFQTADDLLLPEFPMEEAFPLRDPEHLSWGRELRKMDGRPRGWVVIGEIRTPVTAEAMFEALMWGVERVLTTVHAGTAWQGWQRLERFDSYRGKYWEAGRMGGSCHQHLIRRLCPRCSRPFSPKSDLGRTLAAHLGAAAMDHMRQQGPGCTHCEGEGFAGMTGCFELILPTHQPLLNERIMARDWPRAQHLWRTLSDGSVMSPHMLGKTVLEHAWHKVAMGEACPKNVTQTMGPATLAFK